MRFILSKIGWAQVGSRFPPVVKECNNRLGQWTLLRFQNLKDLKKYLTIFPNQF